ncbi:MAG TPA: glycerol-3-phosphate 1-O-acyltransferase PlsY [Rhodobacteraceae bacterium]|nr:glycerol-3-phosphate 1-O-acyltransferase PlsY [Paracoccaceae bacterium]
MGYLIVGLSAYLLGSVPFGLVMARLFGLGDIRLIGSGNIGATNVLRTGNKLAAFLTLVLDAGKGAVAVLVARQFGGEAFAGIAALGAMLGHLYPVFLRFKGGKGVATFLGTLLALAWPVGLAACATWLVTAILFRYSSLAALVASALAPIYMFVWYHTHTAAMVLFLAALIFYKHRANIRRLLTGKEPKIGQK